MDHDTRHYDAIIVGGGHNGLTCAAYLARAGKKVLLLEAREQLGGLCAAETFHIRKDLPFIIPGLHHETHTFSRKVASDLGLARHGLKRSAHDPILVVEPSGRRFNLNGATLEGAETLTVGHARWRSMITELAPYLARVTENAAPNLHPRSNGELLHLALSGLRLRSLGIQRMVELMRVTPMSVMDWMDEYLDDRGVAEAIAAPSLVGSFHGPWSSGTAFNLLLTEALRDAAVLGGPAAITDALAQACLALGAEVHTNRPVVRIEVVDGRATGVALESGERISAKRVLSALDPRKTMLDMIEPGALPLAVEEAYANVRCRGTLSKVHIAMHGAFNVGDESPDRLRLTTGGLESLERAFDAAKYGECSELPYLDIRVGRASDRPHREQGDAPPGCVSLSVMVGYTPYDLRGGWTEEARKALLDRVIARIDEVVPGIKSRILASELLTPVDIEERYGATEGQILHAEPALDQMLAMRPTLASARHATPVSGLYFCGSGAAPLGGVTGLPGMLAAKAAGG